MKGRKRINLVWHNGEDSMSMVKQRTLFPRKKEVWWIAGICPTIILITALISGCACACKRNDASTKSVAASDGNHKEIVLTQTKLPRLLDLGAGKCIPCKMMAPILEELKKEYAARLEVQFVDVWKNPKEGKRYGIHFIPTQIFYDTDGKEFYRHVGFFSKKDILKTFREKGINLNEN